MSFLSRRKESREAIGCFAYTKAGEICCDGDACIIAGSEELMKSYLRGMGEDIDEYIIRQTYYDEIIAGIRKGAYAFDEEAYDRFFCIAELNGIGGELPPREMFLEYPEEKMNLVRIQFFGT